MSMSAPSDINEIRY